MAEHDNGTRLDRLEEQADRLEEMVDLSLRLDSLEAAVADCRVVAQRCLDLMRQKEGAR